MKYPDNMGPKPVPASDEAIRNVLALSSLRCSRTVFKSVDKWGRRTYRGGYIIYRVGFRRDVGNVRGPRSIFYWRTMANIWTNV